MSNRAPNESQWSGFAACEMESLKHKKLISTMVNTIVDYQLIAENDHIMVAISGGKDSYTLLDLLLRARKRAPFFFEVTAVHLDQVQPGYDGAPLKNWLEDNNINHKIVSENTYKIVAEKTKPGGTYCAICSRLRRGILYRIAGELGANKVALGHHRDDAIETLMLNLIYAGKMQAMPPKYLTDDKRFHVIRPLVEVAESNIISWAKFRDYPILPCNLCGSQEGLKRVRMKELLNELEKEKPDVRRVMHNAIKNVKTSHLLDPRFIEGARLDESGAAKKRLAILN